MTIYSISKTDNSGNEVTWTIHQLGNGHVELGVWTVNGHEVVGFYDKVSKAFAHISKGKKQGVE